MMVARRLLAPPVLRSAAAVGSASSWRAVRPRRGALPSLRSVSMITVGDQQLPLPYEGCTILTVLEKADMAGRADCRQGRCKKCAVDVEVDGESAEVLSCQEMAIDGLKISLPANWEAKPRWANPHPEKVRITTRELKSDASHRAAPLLGKQLKEVVRRGNYSFRKMHWEDVVKAIDEVDQTIERYGFSAYMEFARISTLTRDLVPDFLVALSLAKQAGLGPVPQELPDKAEHLAQVLREHLEAAGLSAAAFNASQDDATIGSHGVGKKGAQTQTADGGGSLTAGAFYRNFCMWPEPEQQP